MYNYYMQKGTAFKRIKKIPPKKLTLGKYCYIQGLHKALVVEQKPEFVRCIPLEFYKDMKKRNVKAKRKDFIYTFVPSLIYETEKSL